MQFGFHRISDQPEFDDNGQVTFTTIYPGWYAGRATHIHVDVFINGAIVKTTQIAFPESTTASVHATGVYAAKGRNSTTNASDNVFSDGTSMRRRSKPWRLGHPLPGNRSGSGSRTVARLP
jgi:protocatechuate 3,4-dioxygenase beta subunit